MSQNKHVRDDTINILCLQETHLNPTKAGNSTGVAFILNKEKINTSDTKMTTLIPGRAIALTIKWHSQRTIKILNMYTLNDPKEHPTFWNIIKEKWRQNNLGTMDFMMGDFNIMEDPLDRAPARHDNEQATKAPRDFRLDFDILDTWRHTFPTTRLFTFNSNVNTMSHPDRIYTSKMHQESMSEWKLHLCPIPMDHNIVLTIFTPPGVPHIGKGRKAWHLRILTDKSLLDTIVKQGIETQEKIERHTDQNRTEAENPQTLWEYFKNQMNPATKQTAKTHLVKTNQ
ncbi:hypothetical protein BDR04DRAFT_1126300 [Suillus decipiens]|nr:hypothetical protein BDR04DRAFT_1126300 [Suillus decipiens]